VKNGLPKILLAILFVLALTPRTICAQEAEQQLGLTGEIMPTVRYITVDGDEEKFREDWWTREGWAGGLERFTHKHTYRNGVSVYAEGRAILGDDDYSLRLEMDKPEVGLIHAGYRKYRKYFDGTGGFYGPFTVPPFELNNDIHLDIGDVTLEVGLTLPRWPRIVLGYEHRFKDGKKSLLEWGSVTEGGVTRKIFPSFKEIDEEVDIFKGEIAYDIGKVHLGNQFRYEDYRTVTTRSDEERNLDTNTSETVTVSEKYDHDAFHNTFHAESHLSEKIYWSLGYLFTTLEGDAGFRMFTVPFGPEPFDKNWLTEGLDIDQVSHVLNVNALFAPFKHFTIYGGLEAESTDTDGDTDAVLTEILPVLGEVSPEAVIPSRNDKTGFEETVGARYTCIPYTTLYAEGKWTQQSIDLFERELEDGALEFERSTDTGVERQRYTFGLNTSPIARTSFSVRYRRSYRKNDYDHNVDTEAGYSAFITKQRFTTDQITAKLTVRPISRVKALFQYQREATDIDTRSDTNPPSSVTSGDYEANIYTASVTVTPLARLYLTGLFSYRDARTTAFDNGVSSVIAYDADVFTVIGTAGYAVDSKTDLNVKHVFTRSDNFEDNSANGLPFGLDNERHGFEVSLSRRVKENIMVRLGYGFYKYEEDSNGGANDYTAHLFGGSLTYRF
jgi:hypothetical protein